MKLNLIKHKHLLLIFIFTSILITNAQEVRVIDNKGTITKVKNNNVYTSNTNPTLITTNKVVENDVWFDTSDTTNTITKIYDGTNWVLVNSKVKLLQDTDADTKVYVEKNTDEDIIRFNTNGAERMQITANGNVSIGNNLPNTKAILDLTNSQKFAFILPSESQATDIVTPSEGMLIHSTNKKNSYLRTNNIWKPIAYNRVVNELIFDGEDDTDPSNDNFYYVSFVVNDKWKVIRYDKTDVNVEDIADETTNTSQTTQPLTLAECSALVF